MSWRGMALCPAAVRAVYTESHLFTYPCRNWFRRMISVNTCVYIQGIPTAMRTGLTAGMGKGDPQMGSPWGMVLFHAGTARIRHRRFPALPLLVHFAPIFRPAMLSGLDPRKLSPTAWQSEILQARPRVGNAKTTRLDLLETGRLLFYLIHLKYEVVSGTKTEVPLFTFPLT